MIYKDKGIFLLPFCEPKLSKMSQDLQIDEIRAFLSQSF